MTLTASTEFGQMQPRLPRIWYYRDDYLRIRLEPHEVSRVESQAHTAVRKRIPGQTLVAIIPNHLMGPGLQWAPAHIIGHQKDDNISIRLAAPDGAHTTWTLPEEELQKILIRDETGNGDTVAQSRLFP